MKKDIEFMAQADVQSRSFGRFNAAVNAHIFAAIATTDFSGSRYI